MNALPGTRATQCVWCRRVPGAMRMKHNIQSDKGYDKAMTLLRTCTMTDDFVAFANVLASLFGVADDTQRNQ